MKMLLKKNSYQNDKLQAEDKVEEADMRRPGKSARNRPNGPAANRRIYGNMTGFKGTWNLDLSKDKESGC